MAMLKILPFAFVASVCAAAPAVSESRIAIGGDEPLTHLHFTGIPKDAKITRLETRLIVDKASPNGLNFFAIQVNFPNNTWAHGGPQLVKGANGPVEQVNWGGLVNRGGGSKDYVEANPAKDLALIEHGIGKANTVPSAWFRGREYSLVVERGAKVTLPAGPHKAAGGATVPERTMWEWKFTLAPTDKSHAPFTSLLYDSADSVQSFYLWNEAGYGSTSKEQLARWTLPVYRVEGSAKDETPSGWKRF